MSNDSFLISRRIKELKATLSREFGRPKKDRNQKLISETQTKLANNKLWLKALTN